MLQRSEHGGDSDFASEYGFSSPLDETTSTTTTATTAMTGTESLSNDPSFASSAVRKGLLWQQRDKMFSRWKERFFILTPDYLQCFKKGTSRITEMGGFIFKQRLSEVRRLGDYSMRCNHLLLRLSDVKTVRVNSNSVRF